MPPTDEGLRAADAASSTRSSRPVSQRRSAADANEHEPVTSPFRLGLACAVVLAVALGVGRFAFTPLMPMMLREQIIDIRGGGWLASCNYAGYFIGALTCAMLRVDHARMIRVGLVVTVVLTIAMGITHAFWVWAALRTIAGVVSAWTFVFASQWGLRKLAEGRASEWGGLIYTGPGAGILVTGLAASVVVQHGSAAGWIGFGVLSAALTALVWPRFGAGPRSSACTSAGSAVSVGPSAGRSAASTRFDAISLSALYGVAGFGYIITATFLPVIARQTLQGSVWPDLFWPLFGAATIPGALLGSRLPRHWDNCTALAICYVIQAAGIGLGIVAPSVAGFALGSMLIGLPFTAITLFAMRDARRLHGERAAGLMGYATAVYGAGQIAGPLIAAPIAARTGSFTIALEVAVAALLAGAVLLFMLGRRQRAHALRVDQG
jgi:predicted MFS family arabinose efflux permease